MSVIYKNGTYYGAGGGGGGADTEIIADDFDATESYAVGEYVVYEGVLYKCTTAHTGAWDASDFDDTQVMAEMPTPMPADDMSGVVTPLPGVMSRRFKYSTEEQVVGEWIDGKPLYQITLRGLDFMNTLGAWTNISTSQSEFERTCNIAVLVSAVASRLSDSACTSEFVLKYNSSTNRLQYYTDGASMSSANILTIQYTKTTD